MGKIYKITNMLNNKIYIGKTTQSIDKRFKEHIQEAKRYESNKNNFSYNSKLYPAMCKYGYDNFIIDIIEDNIEENKLNDKERFYITEFDSINDNIGYNISPGGLGGPLFKGHKHSVQTKKLLSEKNYWRTHKQPKSYVEKRVKKHRRFYQNLTTLEIICGCIYKDNILGESYSISAAVKNHRKIRDHYWVKIGSDKSKKLTRAQADKVIAKYDYEYNLREKNRIKKSLETRKNTLSKLSEEELARIKKDHNNKVKKTKQCWTEEFKNKLRQDRVKINHEKHLKRIAHIDTSCLISDYNDKMTLKNLMIKYNIKWADLKKIIEENNLERRRNGFKVKK